MRKLLLVFFVCVFSSIFSQVTLSLNVTDGESTTTCVDGTFGGGPEPHWSLNIEGEGYVTYPSVGICYIDFPNVQYQEVFDCAADYPSTIQVCLRAFEDDGAACIESTSCLEEVCQNFVVPNPGSSVNYSLSVTGDSDGSADFTITATGTLISSADLICNAINLGTLSSTSSLGNDALSNNNNICGTSTADPNPWGGGNEAGVWFTFTTSGTPSSTINMSAKSDPQMVGDEINIQLALYESSNGTCTGTLTFVEEETYDGVNDTSLPITCLEPNTTYFLLLDGEEIMNDNLGVGRFGIEIVDDGVDDPADGCSPLPVELISFYLVNEEKGVKLIWETLSEINNDFFIVEASHDGLSFKKLEQVSGFGNSSIHRKYVVHDLSPSPGITYYRLKQYDYDGLVRNLGVLRNELISSEKTTISPNVTSSQCDLTLFSYSEEKVFVEIVDLNGSLKRSYNFSSEVGSNVFRINLYGIKRGVYVVMIHRSEAVEYHRLIIT